ncbi:hypothetical protein A3A78_01370, partial [candidate division WWE3 bacterium RIFCSPLOWO2_01_FULL_41_18]
SNVNNTGSLLELNNTGGSSNNTSLYIKHYADGTGPGNFALRVDDVSGDTSPFVIDELGNVGVGTTNPDSKLHTVGGDVYIAPDTGYTFNNPSANEDLYVFGNAEVDGILYAGSTPVALTLATGFIDADAITLTTTGGTGTTLSNSGLEVVSDGLTLLKGCTDGQILKWDNTGEFWYCATDGGASITTLQDAYGNDADGSNATISLTADDDSLIFRNPASSGTDSAYTLFIDQLNTTGAVSALDITTASNNSDAVNLTANSIDGETVLDINANGITSGKGINLASTSNGYTSGNLLNLALTQSAATGTTVAGDILIASFSPTYSTAVTSPTISGSVFDISRSAITNTDFASTLTVSGALALFSDSATQTTGTLTHTANVVDVTQNYTSSSGTALYVKNYGGSSSASFRVDDSSGDTTPFYIDASGNVAIGNATPTAAFHISTAGAASTPAQRIDGTWFTGGSTTTTKPQLLIEPSGTTSTSWSTSGTGLGINAATAFAGNLIDFQQNAVSTFKVAGVASAVNGFTFTTRATGTAPQLASSGSDTNIGLAINSKGTGSITFTSAATTGTTTSSAFVHTSNSITSGTGNYFSSSTINTGKLVDINTGAANTLTSGTLLNVESTATSLTAPGAGSDGSLATFDWTPGSSATASGDLFSINIGSLGTTTGNLFSIKDASSSIFSVSENTVTSNLPATFNAAGDVAVAYDLNFTNQTSSNILSSGPLYITVGEIFENNDLTLKTYGTGDLILDTPGGVTLIQAQNWNIANSSPTSLNIESGLLNIDTSNTRVGIGTTAPSTLLDVQGVIQGNFADSSATTSLCASANATSDTDIVQCTGVDYGEYTPSSGTVEQGDLLSLSSGDPTEEKAFAVKRASSENINLYGIYSTAGIYIGKEKDETYIPVALSGRAPLKVSREGGEIKKGDRLTFSSKAGVAKKATEKGYTVGMALEDYDGSFKISQGVAEQEKALYDFKGVVIPPPPSGVGKILVFVNVGWYDPSAFALEVTNSGSLAESQPATPNYTTEQLNKKFEDIDRTIGLNTQLTSEEIIKGAETSQENKLLGLKNENMSQDAEIAAIKDRVMLLEEKLNVEEASSSAESSESANPTYSTETYDLQSQIDSLKQTIDILVYESTAGARESSPSAILSPDSVVNNLTVENLLKIPGDLQVSGKTYLAQTNIAGVFTVGFITINDSEASINSISEPLKIQNNSLADIDIFNGKVRFTADGSLTLSETIKAKKVEAKKVTAEEYSVKSSSANVGSGVLKAGDLVVSIGSSAIKERSIVFTAPTSPTGGQSLIVSAKKENGYFEVSIERAFDKDISFDWLIVNKE